MDLPALPDIFGNYALQGLAEILAPEHISWLPSTSGWKALLVIGLLLCGRLGWRRWQRWRRNRYRSAALDQIAIIVEGLGPSPEEATVGAQQLARLIKSVALQASPRTDVAALTGEAWRHYLDSSCDEPVFGENSREYLLRGQYQARTSINQASVQQLASESARWIRLHREPAHD